VSIKRTKPRLKLCPKERLNSSRADSAQQIVAFTLNPNADIENGQTRILGEVILASEIAKDNYYEKNLNGIFSKHFL
jgi:hypothetical protein